MCSTSNSVGTESKSRPFSRGLEVTRHASGSAARCVRFIATVVFACGAPGAHAQKSVDQETRKIEYLIHEVQSLQGAQFFRNGVGYDGNAAADHLRLKWRAAGSRVTTAADFIRL